MNKEQKRIAILERLKKAGIEVDEPITTLSLRGAARIKEAVNGSKDPADPAGNSLGNILKTIYEALKAIGWEDDTPSRPGLVARKPLPVQLPTNLDGHLEAAYEDRVSGAGG